MNIVEELIFESWMKDPLATDLSEIERNILKERIKVYRMLTEEAICEEDEESYGYYLQAIRGFEFQNLEDQERFQALIKTSENDCILYAKNLNQLVATLDGRKFWAENGFAFEGKLDLKDDNIINMAEESNLRWKKIIKYRETIGETLGMMETLLVILRKQIVKIARFGVLEEWKEKKLNSDIDIHNAIIKDLYLTGDPALETLRTLYKNVITVANGMIQRTSPPINFGKLQKEMD